MTWPAADRWRAPVGDWPPAWASAWGSDRYGLWADLAVNGVTQRLRWIEPSGLEGFLMGSTKAERDAISDKGARERACVCEREPQRVVVNQGFWLADTPCAQAFWVQIAEGQTNPSLFRQGDEAERRPVEHVSWDDVHAWFEMLAQQCPATTGLADLPTEVQWEYAGRAGTSTAYWWGDEFDEHKANVDVRGDRDQEGTRGATTPVARYVPNPWGLYDMHGNVWEWCEDVRVVEWPDGESQASLSARVIRGGSWLYPPGYARSAFRHWWHRDDRSRALGFRLSLRSPGQVPGPEAQGPEGRAR